MFSRQKMAAYFVKYSSNIKSNVTHSLLDPENRKDDMISCSSINLQLTKIFIFSC